MLSTFSTTLGKKLLTTETVLNLFVSCYGPWGVSASGAIRGRFSELSVLGNAF